MEKNLPVTDTEHTFDPSERLVSTTDKKGIITHCNDAFVRVSGFTRDELIGKPHNIVRHPDMPPLAYEVMWSHLKTGQPWMGLVKNRCKNGDYYWVDACVTPITVGGEIIGYESVRSVPTRKDVQRAERLYRQINRRGFRNAGIHVRPEDVAGIAALTTVGALLLTGFPTWATGLAIIAGIGYGGWNRRHESRVVHALNKQLLGAFSHPLAVRSYTDERGSLGRLKVAIKSEQSRMTTVLTRIEDASQQVTRRAADTLGLTNTSQLRH